MTKDVSFDEKKHLYTRKSDGAWLQGVSTVSSIVPKDWLSAWGSKEACKFLGYSDYEGDTERAKEMLEKIKKCETIEEYQAILKEAKGASWRKSKEALIDGTAGHLWLDNFIEAKIKGTELPAIPEGNLARPINQFLDWYDEHVSFPIASETIVAYPEKGYAGTLDLIAMMKTGRVALIDFKFASHISEDYYLQLAGYQACFEAYGIEIKDRIIVRLPKTLEREEWDPETKKYSKIENKIEVRIIKSDYETDKNVFFACLPLKRWINLITKK